MDNVVQLPVPSRFKDITCPFAKEYEKHMCYCSEVICPHEEIRRLAEDMFGG